MLLKESKNLHIIKTYHRKTADPQDVQIVVVYSGPHLTLTIDWF